MDLRGNLELTTILAGGVVLVLNVLDSITTTIGLKQYPTRTLEGELNPFMRILMRRNKILAEVLKQVVVLTIVVWNIVEGRVEGLIFLGIMLGLVVVNNSWIIMSRAVIRRKVISPIRELQSVLHLPNWCLYPLVMVILVGLTYLIYWRIKT